MQEIIEKILRADVVIWSFPLYYFGLPGPLKNLIDRQLPMSLPFMSAEAENGGHPSRYDMSDKRTVVISTCGFYTAKGNYSCVSDLFDRLCGQGRLHRNFLRPGRAFQGERAGGAHRRVPFLGQKGREGVRIQRHQRGDPAASSTRTCSRATSSRRWRTRSRGIGKSGEKEVSPARRFTRRMAALYRRQAWPGRDVCARHGLHRHPQDLPHRSRRGRKPRGGGTRRRLCRGLHHEDATRL